MELRAETVDGQRDERRLRDTVAHLKLFVSLALIPTSFPPLLHQFDCYQALPCILRTRTRRTLHRRGWGARRQFSMPIAKPYCSEGTVSEDLDWGVGARRGWIGLVRAADMMQIDIQVCASPTTSWLFWMETLGIPTTVTVLGARWGWPRG